MAREYRLFVLEVGFAYRSKYDQEPYNESVFEFRMHSLYLTLSEAEAFGRKHGPAWDHWRVSPIPCSGELCRVLRAANDRNPICPTHGGQMFVYSTKAGTRSKAGKRYWRCSVEDCKCRESTTFEPVPRDNEDTNSEDVEKQDDLVLLTRDDVASYFGVHVRTVASWLCDPTFPGRPSDRGDRNGCFPVETIRLWLDGRKNQHGEQKFGEPAMEQDEQPYEEEAQPCPT